jgi:hypothetical protein
MKKTAAIRNQKPEPVDFWARLQAYQPVSITAADARELDEGNRGDAKVRASRPSSINSWFALPPAAAQ